MSPHPTATMKPTFRLLTISLALCGLAAADLPKKPTIRKYTKLWTDSPFTSKPLPVETQEEAVFEDYTLGGVSPINQGYRVTLLVKKEPSKRVVVETGRKNEENFKLLAVTRKSGDPLGTVVRMSSGNKTGTIGFDEKYLKLTAAPAARKTLPGKTGTPQQLSKSSSSSNSSTRKPRPRVVPPPTSSSNKSSSRKR